MRDLKITKYRFFQNTDIPVFPLEEWDNVLCGKLVDLDRAFSGSYSTSSSDTTKEKLGELEIVHKSRVPDKRVKSSADWNRAWNDTVEAITFVFPHRLSELSRYGKHINRAFGKRVNSSADRVVEYDRACRKYVADTRTHDLSNIAGFADLRDQFLGWDGVREDPDATIGQGSPSVSGGSAKAPRQKKDPCRRFNNGVCPSTAASCRYKHICSRCRSPSHAVKDCSESK